MILGPDDIHIHKRKTSLHFRGEKKIVTSIYDHLLPIAKLKCLYSVEQFRNKFVISAPESRVKLNQCTFERNWVKIWIIFHSENWVRQFLVLCGFETKEEKMVKLVKIKWFFMVVLLFASLFMVEAKRGSVRGSITLSNRRNTVRRKT